MYVNLEWSKVKQIMLEAVKEALGTKYNIKIKEA
jgi:hypothetical protein